MISIFYRIFDISSSRRLYINNSLISKFQIELSLLSALFFRILVSISIERHVMFDLRWIGDGKGGRKNQGSGRNLESRRSARPHKTVNHAQPSETTSTSFGQLTRIYRAIHCRRSESHDDFFTRSLTRCECRESDLKARKVHLHKCLRNEQSWPRFDYSRDEYFTPCITHLKSIIFSLPL